MYERSDGWLVDINMNGETGPMFSMFNNKTGFIVSLHLSLSEYENLFRFNSHLMNPNNKKERLIWICERLQLKYENVTLSLGLSIDPVCEVRVPFCSERGGISSGRMSFVERQSLRDGVLRNEKLRTRHIKEKEEMRQRKLIEYVNRLRQEKVHEEDVRSERIKRDEEKRTCRKALEDRSIAESTANRSLKELFRSENLSIKLKQRKLKEQAYIQLILAAKSKHKSIQEQNIRIWRENLKLKTQIIQKEFLLYCSHMQQLNRKRLDAYAAKQRRFIEKARKYAKEMKEQKDQLSRKRVILREKKLDLAYRLFAPVELT
jgi:hypothetical protein